nr:MAG TPA: hypothetical protein [Caudoviricetes sp.]
MEVFCPSANALSNVFYASSKTFASALTPVDPL